MQYNPEHSSPGPDSIHYIVIKHFPTAVLVILPSLFNIILSLGTFPKRWGVPDIVPIPKHNKDISKPQSYGTISLTNCLCKTFERIITARLMWYLCQDIATGRKLYLNYFFKPNLLLRVIPSRVTFLFNVNYFNLRDHTMLGVTRYLFNYVCL